MKFRDEVKIVYALADYEWAPNREIRAIILDENPVFYTIAVIERKMLLGKRYILKIEEVFDKDKKMDFKFRTR